MITLGDVWVIAGTACLALAIEMIWFSSLGFGSRLDPAEPDRLERFTVERLLLSLIAFLILGTLTRYALDQGMVWWKLTLVGAGVVLSFILTSSGRQPLQLKVTAIELGFYLVLLTALSYVMAYWPW